MEKITKTKIPGDKNNMNDTIFVVSNKVVHKNAKIDWPDLNYPNQGMTILRTLHDVDYKAYKIQLDGADGPWFSQKTFPEGVGFYKQV
jgi:hypothetical protein